MKEVPLSLCERSFILDAISQKKRLDGREAFDYRHVKITFGIDRGCCTLELGDTRVLVQVSCEVAEPKQTRPNEGLLFVNLELSPMAAQQFEPGRQTDYGVEINRLLERCIKESRCVDTESLCIMAGVQVWKVRVDIHVLNHDGNIVDCASVAAITALAHFRRPDVTISGEQVTIHSLEDRDPVPLSVHHMPLCVTFAFYEQGKYVLIDPTDKEEQVMDGKMVIGMNKHREICTMQLAGSMLVNKEQVLRFSNIAVVKVSAMTELIQRALDNDTKARAAGERFGFAASVDVTKVTVTQANSETIDTVNVDNNEDRETEESMEEDEEDEIGSTSDVKILAPGTGQIGEGGPSTWETDEEAATEMMVEQRLQQLRAQDNEEEPILISTGSTGGSDSEEDDVVILDQEDFGFTKSHPEKQSGPKHGIKSIDLTQALKKPDKKKTKAAAAKKR